MSPPAENPAPLSADEPIEEIEDPERLLALAKAYRAGSEGLPRNLEKCFACYRAAASLGSADAEYAIAVFYLTGLVVAQDLKEGAARLRVAADGGVLPAKIYLANLYELGIHFKADPEKANVWYRNAARAAGIKDDPESPDGARALARLGAVRQALELVEDPEVAAEERDACLAKAKTLGHQLKQREAARSSAVDLEPAKPVTAQPAAKPVETARPKAEPKRDPKQERARQRRNQRLVAELAAFGMALFAAAIGLAAAFGAHQAALAARADNRLLPLFGERIHLVFPSVLFALGAIPALLVYRLTAFLYALMGAAVVAFIGWRIWHTAGLALASTQPMQAAIFGLGGFLVTLIALALTRGAARKSTL